MSSRRPSPIASVRDVEEIEARPWAEARPAASTYELIRRAGERFGPRIAIRAIAGATYAEACCTVSFAELAARVTKFANFYTRLGVRPDEPVTLLLPSILEAHLAHWSAEAAGIASPLNPLVELEQLAAIVTATKSRWLVSVAPAVHPEIAEKARRLCRLVPGLTLLQIDQGRLARVTSEGVPSVSAWSDSSASNLLRDDAPRGSDVAAFFSTGGTTGAPKIARQTHDNQVYCAWGVVQALGLDETDVLLCGLPLFHVNALLVTGLAPFLAGAEIVMTGLSGYRTPGVIENFFSLADRFRATIFSAVPTVYAQILDRAVANGAQTAGTSLRYGICGAAPISTTLFEEFQQSTGIKIVEGYGLTVGTCVSTLNPPGGEARLGSVGIRLPYQHLAIVDSNGAQLPVDAVGRLVMRGPHVFAGYLDRGPSAFADGWLDTGDLARIDSDGYVWLAGRSKDIIIRGGHNLDPAVPEEALRQHPAVRDVAVVARVDDRVGEVPVAYVVLKPGMDTTPAELMAHAAIHTSERAAAPLAVHVLAELPVTAIGKVFKPALRQRAAEDALRERLTRNGWKGDIEVSHDPTRGLRAAVTVILPVAAAEERERVARAFGRFPLILDLSFIPNLPELNA